MVFKLYTPVSSTLTSFENDVKEYGFQALSLDGSLQREFENDVKEYGFQALQLAIPLHLMFENDVKEYGFQAQYKIL